MTIYEHKTSITVLGGSNNTVTLSINGGLARYLMVRANTSTTVFRTNLQDDDNVARLNYDFHEGEIIDDKLVFPVAGRYRISVTNASPNDTFRIIFAVQED